jgi:hypothetical protein
VVSELASSIDTGPNRAKIGSKEMRIRELESQIASCNEALNTVVNSHSQCEASLKAEKCKHEIKTANLVAEIKDLKEAIERLLSDRTRCRHEKDIADLVAEIKDLKEAIEELSRNQTRRRPFEADHTNNRAPTSSASPVSPPALENQPQKRKSLSPMIVSSEEDAKSEKDEERPSLEQELEMVDWEEEPSSTDSEISGMSDGVPEAIESHNHMPGEGNQEVLEMNTDAPRPKSLLLARESKRRKIGSAMQKRLAKNPLRNMGSSTLPPHANTGLPGLATHSKALGKHQSRRLKLKSEGARRNQEPSIIPRDSKQEHFPDTSLEPQRPVVGSRSKRTFASTQTAPSTSNEREDTMGPESTAKSHNLASSHEPKRLHVQNRQPHEGARHDLAVYNGSLR